MPKTSRKPQLVNGALAVCLIAGIGLAAASVGAPAQATSTPITAAVQRGTVSTTVTATGNVQPAQNLAVNFKSGGTLTEIDVAVGQQVAPGQVLAKVDPTDANIALHSAQANLTAAQGKLAQIEQVQSPQEQAQNAAGLAQSQTQLTSAEVALADSRRATQADAINLATAVNQAIQQYNQDVNKANSDQPGSQQQATDQATVAKDRDAVQNAQDAQQSGAIKDQQSLDQAQSSVNSAQASLTATEAGNAVKSQPPKVGDLASAQAAVAQAQASVETAQETVNNTTLVAPAPGTVASIASQVGETVGSSGGSSSSSSSSSSSTGSSSGGGGGGATGASGTASSASSSSGFMVLTNVSNLQVLAGFTEGDAAKLQVGQPATVTVAALPGKELAATVSEIDTLQTVVSNVVTYNVLFNLNDTVPGLKPGMTANVAVIVSEKDNVLHVPTAAVSLRTGGSTVTVMNGKKQQSVPVVTGLRGDNGTEVDSGLTEGQLVVVSTGTSTRSAGTGRPPGPVPASAAPAPARAPASAVVGSVAARRGPAADADQPEARHRHQGRGQDLQPRRHQGPRPPRGVADHRAG